MLQARSNQQSLAELWTTAAAAHGRVLRRCAGERGIWLLFWSHGQGLGAQDGLFPSGTGCKMRS